MWTSSQGVQEQQRSELDCREQQDHGCPDQKELQIIDGPVVFGK